MVAYCICSIKQTFHSTYAASNAALQIKDGIKVRGDTVTHNSSSLVDIWSCSEWAAGPYK